MNLKLTSLLNIPSKLVSSFTSKRYLQKELQEKFLAKKSARKLALDYFDFYYAPLYGNEWNKARVAMFTGQKYTALVNNYSNWVETTELLTKLTALNLFEFSSQYKEKDSNNDDSISNRLQVPKTLKVYCFDNGNTSDFPSPKRGTLGLLNYYCLDGGSVLAAFALGVEKDEIVLDLCASPGGKTNVLLQTLLPSRIDCNDATSSRIERIDRALRSYLPEKHFEKLIGLNLRNNPNPFEIKKEKYDKVLVDVPCTNDRHSLIEPKNSIFVKSRKEERLNLPKVQEGLLIQGINACKTGGSIVYSTCSMSPIQNEGVINTVMQHFKNEHRFKLEIISLEHIKTNLNYFFSFSKLCKTGLLVLPELCKNFGPLYICKIRKAKI